MAPEFKELEVAAALEGLSWAWVGAVARRHLGHRRGHGPAEVLVVASRSSLAQRFEGAALHGERGLLWRGALLHAAPDGLPASLALRGVRLDQVAIEPGGALLDPFEGAAALAAGRLDALPTGDAAAEALVGLRMAALASELGLSVPDAVSERLADSIGRVLKADRDEARELLTVLLLGRAPADGLHALERMGALRLLLPEVAGLIDLHRTSRFHHKDVWAHTCAVVRQAIPRADIRWAALLHDIGKPHTRTFAPPRQVHFFHHDELGAVMFEGVAARFRFSDDLALRVRRLILHHLRANLYVPSWTDAAVRRFGLEMGPVFDDLMHLSRADVTSKRAGRRREAIGNLYNLRTRLERIRREDAARRPNVPKGLGAAIISALGVPAGPAVGELRRLCEDAVRKGQLPDSPDIDVCLRFLREQGAA